MESNLRLLCSVFLSFLQTNVAAVKEVGVAATSHSRNCSHIEMSLDVKKRISSELNFQLFSAATIEPFHLSQLFVETPTLCGSIKGVHKLKVHFILLLSSLGKLL